METLGEFLQGFRKSKNVRLEDIAATTRIGMAYLQALESNEYEKFPSEVVARGFVRAYARCLGIGEKEAMSHFDRLARPFYEQREGARQQSLGKIEQAKSEEARRNRLSKASVVLVIGITFGLLYLISAGKLEREASRSGPVGSEQSPSEGLEIETQTEAQPSMPVHELPVNLPPPLPEAPAAPVRSGPLTLTIEATETTWVMARIDNAAMEEALLQPGDRVIWEAKEQFNLTLGNAGGVKVRLNGKELSPFGPRGAVVKDVLLAHP